MRNALAFILISVAACVLGIGSAWLALEGEIRFGKVQLGQWEIWPLAGDPVADPYTKAYLSRTGTVWTSTTEGLAFFAMQDDSGEPLTSRCTYQLVGTIPRGRLWTLTSQRLTDNLELKASSTRFVTSKEVIWQEDERLAITISKTAQPGNWLPLLMQDTFILILRIYDTPLTSGALDAAINTPLIRKGECA